MAPLHWIHSPIPIFHALIPYFNDRLQVIYHSLFPYAHASALLTQHLSIWLTLAFTIDRYVAICLPFRAEKFCSVSKARRIVAAIYSFAVVVSIPRFYDELSGWWVHLLKNRIESMLLYLVVSTYVRPGDIMHIWGCNCCVQHKVFLASVFSNCPNICHMISNTRVFKISDNIGQYQDYPNVLPIFTSNKILQISVAHLTVPGLSNSPSHIWQYQNFPNF